MKKVILLFLMTCSLSFASAQAKGAWYLDEDSMPQQGPPVEMTLVKADDSPVLLISSFFLSNSRIEVKYYLNQLNCIAIVLTQHLWQRNPEDGEIMLGQDGKPLSKDSVFVLYPKDKEALAQLNAQLGSECDWFEHYQRNIKSYIKQQ